MSSRRAKEIARLSTPPPPLSETIAKIEGLAFKTYETKARSRAAIKNSHRALAYALQMLESYARYANLVSAGVVDSIHRGVIRDLKLEE